MATTGHENESINVGGLKSSLQALKTKYIDDLDSRVDTLEEAVGTGGSVDTRIADAKSEIIGGATSDGNTLKKIEDRVSPLETAIGSGGSIDTRIETAINALDSSASQSAGADGLALSVTETDGKITAISGSIVSGTYDTAGAANTAKTDVIGGATTNGNTLKKLEDRVSPLETAIGSGGGIDTRITTAVNAAKSEIRGSATSSCDTLGEAEAKINANTTAISNEVTARANAVSAETSRAQTAEEQLRTLYNNLQQSKPIPVTTLPSSGQPGVIYRLAGTNSYSDYMWGTTDWILMATYNNAIDEKPTGYSNNLAKSGGIFDYIDDNGGTAQKLTYSGLKWYNAEGEVVAATADNNSFVFPVKKNRTYCMIGFTPEAQAVLCYSAMPTIGTGASKHVVDTVRYGLQFTVPNNASIKYCLIKVNPQNNPSTDDDYIFTKGKTVELIEEEICHTSNLAIDTVIDRINGKEVKVTYSGLNWAYENGEVIAATSTRNSFLLLDPMPGQTYILKGFTPNAQNMVMYRDVPTIGTGANKHIGEFLRDGNKLTVPESAIDCKCVLISVDPSQNESTDDDYITLDNSTGKINNIYFWGDSLTEGVSGSTIPDGAGSMFNQGTNYNLLNCLRIFHGLNNNINKGTGSQNLLTVAARMGAIPLILSSDVTIPSDSTTVQFSAKTAWFNSDNMYNVKLYTTVRAYIEDIEVNLTDGSESDTFSLSRVTSGSSKTVSAGTPIIFKDEKESDFLNNVHIFWAGFNNSGDISYYTPEELAEEQDQVAKKCGFGKYLVLGMHTYSAYSVNNTGTIASRRIQEKESAKKFGCKYFNVRAYLAGRAIYDAVANGYLINDSSHSFPTASDLQAMNDGMVPPSLMVDSGHLNSVGYALLADRIYERLMYEKMI